MVKPTNVSVLGLLVARDGPNEGAIGSSGTSNANLALSRGFLVPNPMAAAAAIKAEGNATSPATDKDNGDNKENDKDAPQGTGAVASRFRSPARPLLVRPPPTDASCRCRPVHLMTATERAEVPSYRLHTGS